MNNLATRPITKVEQKTIDSESKNSKKFIFLNTINYGTKDVLNLFDSLDLDVEMFNEFLVRFKRVCNVLHVEYNRDLIVKIFIKDNNIHLWCSWDGDIHLKNAEYNCGIWSREEALQYFFMNIAYSLNLHIASKILIDFEKVCDAKCIIKKTK